MWWQRCKDTDTERRGAGPGRRGGGLEVRESAKVKKIETLHVGFCGGTRRRIGQRGKWLNR